MAAGGGSGIFVGIKVHMLSALLLHPRTLW
jgi:hypothetical protein